MGYRKERRMRELGLNEEQYNAWIKKRLSAGGKASSSNFAANKKLASKAGRISRRGPAEREAEVM